MRHELVAAEAQFRGARAAVGVARAGQFPSVTTTPSVGAFGTGAASGTTRQYTMPIDVTYAADVWGSIRHSVAANAAVAQAAAHGPLPSCRRALLLYIGGEENVLLAQFRPGESVTVTYESTDSTTQDVTHMKKHA
jgi:hypothetical protein